MSLFLYLLTYVFLDIFKLYIIYSIIHMFLNKKAINVEIELFSFVAYDFIVTLSYILINVPHFNLLFNFLGLFFIMYNYRVSLISKISCSVFVYSLILIPQIFLCKIVSPKILGFIEKSENANLIIVFFVEICLFSIYFIIKFINSIKNKHAVTTTYIFLLSLLSIFLTVFLFFDESIENNHFIFYVLILFFINCSSLYAYSRLIESYNEKFKFNLLKKQNQYYEQQIHTINLLNKNMKSLKHDYKNHLSVINSLLDEKNFDELKKYMEGISDRIHKIDKIIFTDNLVIDSILNFKIDEMVTKGIAYDFDIKIPRDLNINPLDINILISNVLDNAIQATSKETNLNKHYIKFTLRLNKNILSINCNNTFDGKIKKQNGALITLKKDFLNSGIGLFNINNVVKKYNGIFKINFDNSNFYTNISLILDD